MRPALARPVASSCGRWIPAHSPELCANLPLTVGTKRSHQ